MNGVVFLDPTGAVPEEGSITGEVNMSEYIVDRLRREISALGREISALEADVDYLQRLLKGYEDTDKNQLAVQIVTLLFGLFTGILMGVYAT